MEYIYQLLENPIYTVIFIIVIIILNLATLIAARNTTLKQAGEIKRLERRNAFLEVKVTTLEQELITTKENFEASLIGNAKMKHNIK